MELVKNTDDWSDDERAPPKSLRSCKLRNSCDYSNMRNICKEIINDEHSRSYRILWNEVEHKNLQYEQWHYEDISDDDQDANMTETKSKDDEVVKEANTKCFDVLVKNNFMYT